MYMHSCNWSEFSSLVFFMRIIDIVLYEFQQKMYVHLDESWLYQCSFYGLSALSFENYLCIYSFNQEKTSTLQISSLCSLQMCAPLEYFVISAPFLQAVKFVISYCCKEFFLSYHVGKLCFCHCVMREKNKRRIFELCCLVLIFKLIRSVVWSVLFQSNFNLSLGDI